MTDSPESPVKRTSSYSNAPPLRYPTFPPLSPVEEWLSRSRPTSSMTSDPHPDHQSKSLTESWATLSASDAHSEDGARSELTDIGSLIDQPGPDDVASLDDRYTSSEVECHYDEDEDKSSSSECEELPTVFPRDEDTIYDSNLTTRAAFDQSTDSIEFIEPEKWPEVERVELKHTIRVFEGDEASELKGKLPYNLDDSVLTATVQQTMTKRSLEIDKPFHVLYIGNPEFRNIILDKIGDVLVSSSSNCYESSSTESSRYHVVPTSFGAGAVPNFAELLPIHVQLIVDECTSATSELQVDKPSTLSLNFKNRPSCTSYWTGSEYCVSSAEWNSPDMAILFVSSEDNLPAVSTQRQARAFMERHGIPMMVISEKPLWKMTSELIPVNHHSLHMCLESRRSLSGDSVVLRRYPIDLSTFESITPSQLNRNLASLATIYPKQTYKVTPQSTKFPNTKAFFDSEKYPLNMLPFSCSSRAREMAPTLRLITLSFVSAITVSLVFSGLKIAIVFLLQLFAHPDGSNLAPSSGLATSSILPLEGLRPASASVRTPPGKVQPLLTQLGSHSKAEELMGLAHSTSGHKSERSGDRFEVRVVGDCHVIIKPSQEFVAWKKQPIFKVQVKRHNEELPYELSKLFDGVYTLKLDNQDAYGSVNVTISTVKPPLTQVTQVDFGTPWLKLENWKRAAQAVSWQLTRELTTAQSGLVEVYDQFCNDLQGLVGDVAKKAQSFRNDLYSGQHGSVHISSYVRGIASRSRQLSEALNHNAVQQLLATSTALQGYRTKINQDAKDLMCNSWNKVTALTRPVDMNPVTDIMRYARRSKTLEKAQQRAKSLIWRESCENSKCSVQGRQG